MLEPKDVFTPGRPPIDDSNVYAPRGVHEKDFVQALGRSLIPVVFGDFGVGKTSMARHILLDDDRQNRLVNIESVAGKSFSDILAAILEHIGYEITKGSSTQTQSTVARTLTGEVGALFAGFTAKVAGSRMNGQVSGSSVSREFVVTAPTDSRVLDVCEDRGLVLLVDELHRGEAPLISALTSFIKAASNRPCKKFRIALLGTTTDASRLVDHDPGIDRIIQEIPLPRFDVDEARTVLEQGMHKLAIAIDGSDLDALVRVCVGSPALVQYLGLEIAEAAFSRSPRAVLATDIGDALQSYIRKRAKRLEDSYLKAIETTGPKKYRKQVLRAMAALSDEYVTMDQIVEQVSRQLDEKVPSSALSGPLRELKSESHGKVLRDVERHEGAARVFNLTAFADPSMRTYILMRTEAERTKVIPNPA